MVLPLVIMVLLLLGMWEFYVNLTLAVVTLEEGTSIEKTPLYNGTADSRQASLWAFS